MQTKVHIDSREKEKIPNLLSFYEANKDNYPHIESISVKTNASSDLCTYDGLVGIERKSIADFIGSICGGKLKQQLYELKTNFRFPILLIENFNGIIDCIEKSPRVHPNVIIGSLTSSFAHSNVPAMFVGGFYNHIALGIIEKFYDDKAKDFDSIYSPLRKGYIPSRKNATKEDFQKYIVKGLPNIGDTDGEKLLQYYDYSIYKLVRGIIENPDEILKIDRMGKTKLKKIKEVLE